MVRSRGSIDGAGPVTGSVLEGDGTGNRERFLYLSGYQERL